MVVFSWLDRVETDCFTIHPFCTHEGSGIGNSMTILKQNYPNAHFTRGLAVRGSRANKADKEIHDWLHLMSD